MNYDAKVISLVLWGCDYWQGETNNSVFIRVGYDMTESTNESAGVVKICPIIGLKIHQKSLRQDILERSFEATWVQRWWLDFRKLINLTKHTYKVWPLSLGFVDLIPPSPWDIGLIDLWWATALNYHKDQEGIQGSYSYKFEEGN